MEPFSKNPWSLLRRPEGPLAVHIDSFTELLNGQGYSRSSAHPQTRLVADFSRWLAQQRVPVQEITPGHTERYLRSRARHRRPTRSDAPALRRLLDLLRQKELIAQNGVSAEVTPLQQLVDEFVQYLRQERVLAPATLANYLPFIRCFLAEHFGRGRPRLSALCAADVVGFVQRRAARLHRKRAKVMTTALRSFLQYARFRGEIQTDLAAAVPAVADWSMSSIPRSIAPEHVQRVLASCNRQSAMGRRDYAILLLLARLGLRAGEIVSLRLEDIDWEAGCLSVRGKGSQTSLLPLPLEVGEAIADYLQNGRVRSTSRSVFLRARAPVRGFATQVAVCSVVSHAFSRAGIESPRKGAHQFRHGLACEMLRQEASLAEIGELLRHRSPQTTAIYAKVDVASLRALGLPWPGGAR